MFNELFNDVQGIYEQYATFTQSNQFLGAAVAAFVLGIVSYLARDVPRNVFIWIKDHITVTFELPFDDRYENQVMYNQITSWLHEHSNSWFSRSFSMSRTEKKTQNFNEYDHTIISGKGSHLVRFNGSFFWYRISVEPVGAGSASSITKKSLELKTFGFSTKKLQEFTKMIMSNLDDVRYRQMVFRHGCWFERVNFPRSIDSVITNDNIKHDVLESIDKFMASKDRYIELGINYKLSFLLSGEPGTGKTSFVKAVASHYKYHLCVMSMAGMTDSRIESALEELPPRSILLIEDIDCATASFLTREDDDDDIVPMANHRILGSIDSSKDSTLSGILNILDGINTPDSIIIMMTTNYPERIDPAILRKGRTDHRVILTSLNDEAIRRYAAYAYHGNQLTRSKPFNPIKGCDLQSLIFENDDILSFEKALSELQ